eukprot:TRINITY_DN3985_c0_g1_i1.p1 TRINITY_DN3985_c0_g1~~TRINITY_DN3985_c0_g1_i1.p1  ORF type:complete len:731 (-),score=137.42 TRINITY_DN3985_c0_g1_i1:36-2228(-)
MTRALVLVCLIVTLLVGIVNGAGDDGFNRPGLDLPGMPIPAVPASAEGCEQMCDNDPLCWAWTYTKSTNGCWKKSPVPPLYQDSDCVSGVKGRYLLEPTWYSFAPGTVRSGGWLSSQLEIQATGLAAYLADFWPDIQDSIWIGGKTQDPYNFDERVPYWLNGQTSLMFLVNDTAAGPKITRQIERYLNYILDHQNQNTGWFGADCCEPWPRFLLLMALTQYMEGKPETQAKIIPQVELFFKGLQKLLLRQPLNGWAQYRWQDLLVSVYWMIDYHTRHGDHSAQNFYFDLAEIIRSQGFDWASFYTSPQFPREACRGACPSYATHGVNIGESLKSEAVWHRQTHSMLDYYSTIQRLAIIDQYHGQPSGMFSCSEHLAGRNPSQGTETCTVVETMFSLEHIFEIFGNVSHADLCEQITYNALPAALTGDMWAHVYLQQNNQINSQVNNPSIYVTDGPDSNIYGLAPNYGCCTVNFPQGWPKFVVRMYMRPQNDPNGIGAIFYGPNSIQTVLNNNNPIKIVANTTYPFQDTITYSVQSARGFNFYLRIPAWTTSKASVTVSNNKPEPLTPGTLAKVSIPAGSNTVVVHFPMEFRFVRGVNDSVIIHRGPLVYSLYIPSKWTQLQHYAFNSSDWQIRPTAPWNYGLKLNLNNANDGSVVFHSRGLQGPKVWTEYEAPVYATVKGRVVPQWVERDGAADWVPKSPLMGSGPLENLILYPMGANRLRITDFPVLMN